MSELMDKVIDNLWIGGLSAALDADLLHKNGINSVLSAMRGKIAIQKAFARHQILLDDAYEADALIHFPPCIAWIDSEITRGRGVLVHCQAGMSRSATIIAAYLMYTKKLDVEAALEIIRKARPSIHPNDGFMAQLYMFHGSQYKRTRRNKDTRAFYVERAVKEVLNGDGSNLEMDMFAKYPHSPSDSTPTTPLPQPRRRLRCKMCRQELATREHMVDHGQVGPATPAAGCALSPAVSRRPSRGENNSSRRGSIHATSPDGHPPVRRLSGSAEAPRRPSFGAQLATLTPITPQEPRAPPDSLAVDRERRPSGSEGSSMNSPRRKSFGSVPFGGLSMTPMTDASATSDHRPSAADSGSSLRLRRRSLSGSGEALELQSKDNQSTSALESDEEEGDSADGNGTDNRMVSAVPRALLPSSLASSQELAAQVHPNLAALRSSPLISALSSNSSGTAPMEESSAVCGKPISPIGVSVSPPLLMPNARCSGYFVEPMKWMEPFLESGNMAGKIVCPNKRCAAKLGNYDWAGVCCSCKQWVVPGFCIHKSKVDEIVV